MKDDKKIIIIGSGVAGLVAATELEKRGYLPIILEATDRVGGRVKTDYWEGYQFDHGFQVLLTAYPELKKYLDLKVLNLKYFKPGATIYSENASFKLVDPLREPASLFTALFSPAGSLLDKWKIWRLTVKLRQMTIEEIFSSPSVTTMEYLQNFGFSDVIITNFFRPFFSGIFLEKELDTSSRLFLFIFKMFAEGYAAIPERGMQAIPDQLHEKLQHTRMHLNTRVERIAENRIFTSAGEFDFDAVIVTTEPSKILDGYPFPATNFRSTVNLYFAIPPQNSGGYIGLLPIEGKLINNVSILSDVASGYSPAGFSLISVSVIGLPGIQDQELVREVKNELAMILKIDLDKIKHLKTFTISNALPNVKKPVMHLTRDQMVIEKGIYLAGDYLLGGSLNGAMVSGRLSAEILAEDLDKR